ncbi:MAG: cyclic 2,3-diphosphoglycerate synthase [bacterium]
MARIRTIIQGAAGRDFHNFNLVYRDNAAYEVVAFTATQIPNITGRKYPPALAGKLYPRGIPIYPESDLPKLIAGLGVDEVVFSYSDVSHEHVMHWASRVIASGASFRLLGSRQTMLASKKPVVAVCAVRTGAGKSQTTRKVATLLREVGKRVVVVRHPMPYGDLAKQAVQRFATLRDLQSNKCTIEEMEEYEPHIQQGRVVFAGVDYQAILQAAEKEADIILWDGGNNDMPFYKPDLFIVVADPHRAGDELTYHPGEANLLLADVVIINKIDTASPEDVDDVRQSVQLVNPEAVVIEAASPIHVEDHQKIRGKRALVIEDGPTLTHGEMSYGAGTVAATKFGAAEFIDPRPYASGSIKKIFEIYPDIGPLLPAIGYDQQQIRELEATIARVKPEVVVIGTPVDLRRIMDIKVPSVHVTYSLQEIGKPDLSDVLGVFLNRLPHKESSRKSRRR